MKGKVGAILLAAVMALSLAACGGSSSGESADKPAGETAGASGEAAEVKTAGGPDTLVVGLDSDIVNLDPSSTEDYASGQVLSQIFDTLFCFDKDLKFESKLVEDYEYEDDLTLVVHLKPGIKFSNGDELTAEDVIYSFKRSKYIANSAMQFELYDDVNSTVRDKYTAVLKTTEPFSPQIYKFVWYVTSIVNKKAVEATGGVVTEESCIGTGPYKLVKWYQGDRVELTANENYQFEDLPKIKNITFRAILESNSRAMALESGDIDIAYKIAAADATRFESAPDIDLVRAAGLNTCYLALNNQKPPFDNKLVRQALFHAIDRENAVKIGFGGAGVIANTFFPQDIEGAATDIPLPEYNPEKAKELLKEAGYDEANPLTFTIIAQSSNQNRLNMATFIQENLAAVGIKAEIDAVEQGVFTDTYVGGLHEAMVLGWTDVTVEPEMILGNYDYTRPVLFKTWGYKNQEYTDLLKEAILSVDHEHTLECYHKCQEILHEDVPSIPIVVAYLDEAKKPYVQGFDIDRSWECMNLETVYFDEP
ncbi:MAG: ABC transporter substrate-binding protein [Lachnospiraceae bacterium]|nr:ABC transporter substrate-binding protein [Lachnospiraceae bacterium]